MTYRTIAALKKALGPSHGRAISAVRCRDCRQPVAIGLDDDITAFTARVDPVPLSPLGEAQATLIGLHTYQARRTSSGGTTITRRRARHIRRHPAGLTGALGNYDVWPEHRCFTPGLDRAPRSILDPQPPTADDVCPY